MPAEGIRANSSSIIGDNDRFSDFRKTRVEYESKNDGPAEAKNHFAGYGELRQLFVETIRGAHEAAPHSWNPHVSKEGGFGTDTLTELSQAVKTGQSSKPVRLLYNAKNGNCGEHVDGPFFHHSRSLLRGFDPAFRVASFLFHC